jgi:hypothetical protein
MKIVGFQISQNALLNYREDEQEEDFPSQFEKHDFIIVDELPQN